MICWKWRHWWWWWTELIQLVTAPHWPESEVSLDGKCQLSLPILDPPSSSHRETVSRNKKHSLIMRGRFPKEDLMAQSRRLSDSEELKSVCSPPLSSPDWPPATELLGWPACPGYSWHFTHTTTPPPSLSLSLSLSLGNKPQCCCFSFKPLLGFQSVLSPHTCPDLEASFPTWWLFLARVTSPDPLTLPGSSCQWWGSIWRIVEVNFQMFFSNFPSPILKFQFSQGS